MQFPKGKASEIVFAPVDAYDAEMNFNFIISASRVEPDFTVDVSGGTAPRLPGGFQAEKPLQVSHCTLQTDALSTWRRR